MTTIKIEGLYDVPADELWRYVVRYEALEAAMNGGLVRVKCPAGEEQVGHDVALVFKLFGIVPVGRWRFRVVTRDDAARRLCSEESGTGVRRWAHMIEIDDVGDRRSRLSDTIEIEAGRMTPIVVRFARTEYARRHRSRRLIVEGRNNQGR